jgi:hypothetical protein
MVALTGIERADRHRSLLQLAASRCKCVQLVAATRSKVRYGIPTWCPVVPQNSPPVAPPRPTFATHDWVVETDTMTADRRRLLAEMRVTGSHLYARGGTGDDLTASIGHGPYQRGCGCYLRPCHIGGESRQCTKHTDTILPHSKPLSNSEILNKPIWSTNALQRVCAKHTRFSWQVSIA